MAQRVAFTISLQPGVAKAIDDLADAQGISRSALVLRWITEKMEGEKHTVAIFANPVVANTIIKAFAQPGVLRALADAVGEKLTDEQLELFHRTMNVATEEAAAVVASGKKLGKKRRKK